MPETRLQREKGKWDDESTGYDELHGSFTELYRDIIQRCAASLSANARVIELGCGTGLVTFGLARHVHSIQGIDVSEKMLAIARQSAKREQCENVEFRVGDAYSLPDETGSFDAVLCSYVLDIVEKPDLILKEAHRILNDSGILICVTDCFQDTKRISSLRRIGHELVHAARSSARRIGLMNYPVACPKDSELIRMINDAGFRTLETAIIDIRRDGDTFWNLYHSARKF